MRSYTIETLPTELLEYIFLEALEVNLARASHIIAGAVSREKVYNMFMVQAFWNNTPRGCRAFCCGPQIICDDHQVHTLKHYQRRVPRHWLAWETYRVLPLKDQRILQAKVMSCRWFTFSRLEKIFPILFDLTWEALGMPEMRWEPYTVNKRLARGMLQPLEPGPQQPLTLYRSHHQTRDFRVVDNRTIINRSNGYPKIIRTTRFFSLPDNTPWITDKLKLLAYDWHTCEASCDCALSDHGVESAV